MTDTVPATAGRREWVGPTVIALPCAVYAMDLTVLNLALPALSEDLAPSSSQLLWIVDIYGFLVAGLLVLADRGPGGDSVPGGRTRSWKSRHHRLRRPPPDARSGIAAGPS